MKEQYVGMTVNERLYVSNCMKIFDKAVKKKDINTIIKILKDIDIVDENIDAILKAYNLTRLTVD